MDYKQLNRNYEDRINRMHERISKDYGTVHSLFQSLQESRNFSDRVIAGICADIYPKSPLGDLRLNCLN